METLKSKVIFGAGCLALVLAMHATEYTTEQLAERNYNQAVCAGEFPDYHNLKPECNDVDKTTEG